MRKPTPTISAMRVPLAGSRASSSATSAAPMVCPKSRAVPSMPEAPPLRSRGAAAIMVRLLGDWNRPKPAPPAPCARRCRQAGMGREQRQRRQPAAEHQKSDAAEQTGRIPLRQPSCKRRREAHRDRPGRDQKADFDRRIAETVLQIEGQRHEGQHLGAEGRHRGADRQGEYGNAQQIHRQQRRGE